MRGRLRGQAELTAHAAQWPGIALNRGRHVAGSSWRRGAQASHRADRATDVRTEYAAVGADLIRTLIAAIVVAFAIAPQYRQAGAGQTTGVAGQGRKDQIPGAFIAAAMVDREEILIVQKVVTLYHQQHIG